MIKAAAHAARRLSLSYIAIVALSACGLGTEVGNGHKPRPDENTAQQDPETTPQTTTTGAQEGSSTNDFFANHHPDLLFNNCATPFADDLKSPATLEQRGSNGTLLRKLVATRSDDQKVWTVKEGDEIRFLVTPTPSLERPLAAQVTDGNGQELPIQTTCGSIKLEDEVIQAPHQTKQLRTSVDLTVTEQKFQLIWYKIAGEPDETNAAVLTRVEVKDLKTGATAVWIQPLEEKP